MNNSHKMVLKEITDELELSMISGSFGSRDWGTGAQAVWSTIVGVVSGKSCSWPGGFYGQVIQHRPGRGPVFHLDGIFLPEDIVYGIGLTTTTSVIDKCE